MATPTNTPESGDVPVTYFNQSSRRQLLRKKAHADSAGDLYDPVTGELIVSGAPITETPREGHYALTDDGGPPSAGAFSRAPAAVTTN